MAARASSSVTLYDVPVSNHGARIRMVMYAKGLIQKGLAKIESPMVAFPDGGLRSPGYTTISPQQKMPVLNVADKGLVIAEASACCRYVVERFADVAPAFEAETAEERSMSNMIECIHDSYISGIQGCMYKKMEVDERLAKLRELKKQLDVLEHHLSESGPFVAGESIGIGDCALFPTMIFIVYITPRFGWGDVFESRPKLGKWWNSMRGGDRGDEDFVNKVYDEVYDGLDKWKTSGRWETLEITQQIEENRALFAATCA